MKPRVPLYKKPKWDKTGDPTIDPTLLDPSTGLPASKRHTIENLSKKNLFTDKEWQEVLIGAGLAPASVPDPSEAKASDEEIEKEGVLPVISDPMGIREDEIAAAKKAATAKRIAKMQATRAANKKSK